MTGFGTSTGFGSSSVKRLKREQESKFKNSNHRIKIKHILGHSLDDLFQSDGRPLANCAAEITLNRVSSDLTLNNHVR